MIYLLLSIICSTAILLIFRFIERYQIPTFPVIVINYFAATILGFSFTIVNGNPGLSYPLPFYLLAFIIGCFFVLMFFITARSSQKAGMAVTSIAAKMSVIFPITFSLLIDPSDDLSVLKLTGILAALPGVFLTIYKKQQKDIEVKIIYLPILLFLGMGLVDSLVRYSQFKYVDQHNLFFFSAILFCISAIIGIIISLIQRIPSGTFTKYRVLISGCLLGLVNFGSVFFLISALNHHKKDGGGIDSSVIFGINNIGVVCLSIMFGLAIFKEKLKIINITGIIISLAAILLLAFSVS